MSNRIDRLEARVQALSAQTAPVVLLIETENGSQRMTVSQYNAAGLEEPGSTESEGRAAAACSRAQRG